MPPHHAGYAQKKTERKRKRRETSGGSLVPRHDGHTAELPHGSVHIRLGGQCDVAHAVPPVAIEVHGQCHGGTMGTLWCARIGGGLE